MSTQDVEEYLAVARNQKLQEYFPALKKFNRRRTKLTPVEKRQITRAANIRKLRSLPRDERPEKYLNYIYPGLRKKSDKRYKQEARQLASLDNSGEFKKLGSLRRKLTPAEKGKITRTRKATPGFENTFRVTPEQAKKLPKEVIRGRGSVKGVKLSKMDPDARIFRVRKNVFYVESAKKRYKYIALGDPEQSEVYAQAAEKAFKEGARQVWFYTTHGMAGTGASDLGSFIWLLQNRYQEYVAQTIAQGYDADWLQGIVVRYQ